MRALICLALVACGSGGGAATTYDARVGAPDAAPAPADAAVPDAGPPVFGEVTTLRLSEIAVPPPAKPIESGFPGATFTDYTSARRVAVVDLNGDGALDLFVAPTLGIATPELPVTVWLNDGKGNFRDGTSEIITGPVPTTGSTNGTFVGDYNGDRAPDILIVDQGDEWPNNPFLGERNKLLLSTGDGHLKDVTDSEMSAMRRFNHVSSTGDINGDHCPDFAVTNLTAPDTTVGIYLLIGDCKGHFTETTAGLPREIAQHTGWVPDVNWQIAGATALADLDGDGADDLVTGSYNWRDDVTMLHTLRFLQNDKRGTFTEKKQMGAPAPVDLAYHDPPQEGLRAGVAAITPGDIDKDGKLDLIVGYETFSQSYVVILHNDGGFNFSDVTMAWRGRYGTSSPYSDPWGNPAVPFLDDRYQLIDVNGDGWLDLVRGPLRDILVTDLAGESFIELNEEGKRFVVWSAKRHGQPAAAADIAGLFPARIPVLERAGHPFVFDADGDGVRDLVWISGRHTPPLEGTGSHMTDLARVFVFLATAP